MLTKREAMFIVTTGNPVKLRRFAPRMAIRTSMMVFIRQAFITLQATNFNYVSRIGLA